MGTNEDSGKQAESRCDSPSPGCGVDCCSVGSSGNSKYWKAGIFVIVILFAIAVAAHSLLSKDSKCKAGSEWYSDSTSAIFAVQEVCPNTPDLETCFDKQP